MRLATIAESMGDKSSPKPADIIDDAMDKVAKDVAGIWNDGVRFYPVFMMKGKDGTLFKSKPSAYTFEKLANFIKGSGSDVSSEIVGIFATPEDAKLVYDALDVREEK